MLKLPVTAGSYDETLVPAPSVEETRPLAPEPAPPAPPDVPPAPAPAVPEPKPPTPAPGVFCTTPVLTPRKDPPACVRRTSAAAIGRLYRAIAISRLFSSASEIASFRLSSSTPSLIKESILDEFARFGCGTSVARYVFSGLSE